MGNKRRKKRKSEKTDTEPQSTTSTVTTSSTEAEEDNVEFDPNKLSIVVEGQCKSFNDWTLDYARHYYPYVGQKTYRVPPLDFNTQSLTDVIPLGFTQLAAQKMEDRKKDRSQADVAFMFEEVGRRLEKCPENGRGLFIVTGACYENYLTELKRVTVEGKPPPLPSQVASRGELDLLVLHPEVGIVLIQVKGVGLQSTWKPTEAELRAAVHKKVREAQKQLKRDLVVLQHVMKDLQLQCRVHKVVALPFVSRALLQASLPESVEGHDGAKEDETEHVYLCCEDMTNTDAMFSWWADHLVHEDSVGLSQFQLESIVGRYCGLLSTVSVWGQSSRRVEVRDVAEAVEEMGNRFSNLVLTAQQREALDCTEDLVYLHGPPGTGKSVLMVIKARQWLLQGHDVVVLNVDFGRPGTPIGHFLHDCISQWLSKIVGADSQTDGEPAFRKASAMASSASSDNACGKISVTTKASRPESNSRKDTGSSNTNDAFLNCAPIPKSNSRKDTEISNTKECFVNSVHEVPVTEIKTEGQSVASANLNAPGSAHFSSSSASFSSSSDAENSRDIGQVFRIDCDLGMNLPKEQAQHKIQELMQQVQQTVRPGVPCHFVWDEFYWKDRLQPVLNEIRRQFPNSCIWCAEVAGDKVPADFTPIMLTTVLRCPPAVQSLLQLVNWMEEHQDLYTGDSTVHGLPTDGFRPMLLQHKFHQVLSPLDCVQCADFLIRFFREDLKLQFGEGTHCVEGLSSNESGAVHGASSGSTSDIVCCTSGHGVIESVAWDGSESSSQTQDSVLLNDLPIPKEKEIKNQCLPRRVQFSDIVVLFSYPRKCLYRDGNLLIVKDKAQDRHHNCIENSALFKRMKEAGLPITFCAPNAQDARDIALPAEDKILFSVTNAFIGLERKVVVYIPCESTAYEYPVESQSDIHSVPTHAPPCLGTYGQTTSTGLDSVLHASAAVVDVSTAEVGTKSDAQTHTKGNLNNIDTEDSKTYKATSTSVKRHSHEKNHDMPERKCRREDIDTQIASKITNTETEFYETHCVARAEAHCEHRKLDPILPFDHTLCERTPDNVPSSGDKDKYLTVSFSAHHSSTGAATQIDTTGLIKVNLNKHSEILSLKDQGHHLSKTPANGQLTRGETPKVDALPRSSFVFHENEDERSPQPTVAESSGISGNEMYGGETIPAHSELSGDESCRGQTIPAHSELSGDESCRGQTIPAHSGLSGDESCRGQTIPAHSGLSGDESCRGQTIPAHSGLSGDESCRGQTIPAHSGLSGDESCRGQTIPAHSGLSGDESCRGQTIPAHSGLSGDESCRGQTIPVHSGLSGDESCRGQTIPVHSGLSGDERCGGQTVPAHSGLSGDERCRGQTIPVHSGLSGDERCRGQTIPVHSGLSGDESCRGQTIPAHSGLSGDERGRGQTIPVHSGLSGDERCGGQTIPAHSGLSGDEGCTIPVHSGLSGDERCGGQTIPANSGLSGDERCTGQTVHAHSGLSGDKTCGGQTIPVHSGLSGDEGCTIPVHSGLSGDEGCTIPVHSKLSGNERCEGETIRVLSGLSEEEWGQIQDRMLEQNQKGMFYAASRCVSVFVLVIP